MRYIDRRQSMAKRFTYEDAVRAMAMLDELGVVGGEARQEAEQEIIDKLGDKNFPESIGGLGLGDLQRARDKDSMVERQEEERAKKQKAIENIKALHALTNAVTSEQEARKVFGTGPLTEKEFEAIRAMYGKYGE